MADIWKADALIPLYNILAGDQNLRFIFPDQFHGIRKALIMIKEGFCILYPFRVKIVEPSELRRMICSQPPEIIIDCMVLPGLCLEIVGKICGLKRIVFLCADRGDRICKQSELGVIIRKNNKDIRLF